MARAGLAAIVVEGMDGDAEAGGVGGAGLAAGGEVLGQNEELLTGAAGAFHPYTSAHGGGRWKAGVSPSDTLKTSQRSWIPPDHNSRRGFRERQSAVDKSTLPSHPGNNYLCQFLLMNIRIV